MAYIIEAAGLKKTFADVTAVDGISFQVNQGECFGILGPNGAGKNHHGAHGLRLLAKNRRHIESLWP